jgi:hypothetical protein
MKANKCVSQVLVQCTIGDLYFVHERATRIAVWNLFLLTGISGGALVAGYIIEYDGYQWTFGVCAIFFGILLFAVIFLVPETTFRRDSVVVISETNAVSTDVEKPGTEHVHLKLGHEHDVSQAHGEKDKHLSYSATHGSSEPKMSYMKSLRVFTGRYSYAPIVKIFTRPVILFFYPAVFWGFLMYGTTLTWIVVFSVVNGVIFVAPPYNFTVSQVGLISLSPFILTLVGEVISGPVNDAICVYLTKKVSSPRFAMTVLEPYVFAIPLLKIQVADAISHQPLEQRHLRARVSTGPDHCHGHSWDGWFFRLRRHSTLSDTLVWTSLDVWPRQHEPGIRVNLRVWLRDRFLPETQRGSICGHQCSKSPYLWADILCQQLACTRRCSASLLHPWGSVPVCMLPDSPALVSIDPVLLRAVGWQG